MRNHNVRLATNTSATHFLLLGTNIVSDVRDKPVAGIQWVDVFMAGSGDLRNVLVSAYQGLMYSYWDKTVSGKKDCNAVLSRCGAELDAAGNWPDRWCWQLKGNLRSRLYVRRLTAAASVASYLRIFFFFCNHRSNHRLWTWLWTNVSKSYFTNAPTPFITSKLLVSPHVVSYKSYGLKVNSVSAKKLKTPIPSWL